MNPQVPEMKKELGKVIIYLKEKKVEGGNLRTGFPLDALMELSWHGQMNEGFWVKFAFGTMLSVVDGKIQTSIIGFDSPKFEQKPLLEGWFKDFEEAVLAAKGSNLNLNRWENVSLKKEKHTIGKNEGEKINSSHIDIHGGADEEPKKPLDKRPMCHR